jgi:hypothetical protein
MVDDSNATDERMNYVIFDYVDQELGSMRLARFDGDWVLRIGERYWRFRHWRMWPRFWEHGGVLLASGRAPMHKQGDTER